MIDRPELEAGSPAMRKAMHKGMHKAVHQVMHKAMRKPMHKAMHEPMHEAMHKAMHNCHAVGPAARARVGGNKREGKRRLAVPARGGWGKRIPTWR